MIRFPILKKPRTYTTQEDLIAAELFSLKRRVKKAAPGWLANAKKYNGINKAASRFTTAQSWIKIKDIYLVRLCHVEKINFFCY